MSVNRSVVQMHKSAGLKVERLCQLTRRGTTEHIVVMSFWACACYEASAHSSEGKPCSTCDPLHRSCNSVNVFSSCCETLDEAAAI